MDHRYKSLCLLSTAASRVVAVILTCMLVVGPAAAKWQDDLTYEIADRHGCEVSFISHVVEQEVDGKQMIMAKVHCEDQRTFDAVRFNEFDLFEFKECTFREKQTC